MDRFAVVIDLMPYGPCFLPESGTGQPRIFTSWEDAFKAAADAQFKDPSVARKRLAQIPENAKVQVIRLQDG